MHTNVETLSEGPASHQQAGVAAGGHGLEPGTLLQDTYRIEHVIATGGMGEVYRATHERLEGAFAIKVLHHELLTEEGLLSRFQTEAKIMASLHHPNIVQVFDFNLTPGGTPYLVMELAEGQDLRTIMTEQRVLPPHRVSQIVEQTASALGAAHAHGVIHRDLKPENVMLVPIEGQRICVKVVDFGVSKTTKASWQPHITQQATVIGTPEYMSPEQAQGLNDEVDHRTDQFALAALAYSLLSGCEPFRAQTPVAVLYQVVHEQPTSLAHLVTWPCSHIEAVLQKAMAKDREDRYASIIDFSRAFTQAVAVDLNGEPQPAGEPQNQQTTPLPVLRSQSVIGRRRRLSSEVVDVDLHLEARTRRTVERHANRPRPQASRRSWRLAVMTFGAACVAAATVALSTAAPDRFSLTSKRVASVYDALSTSANKLLHFGATLKVPESAAE